MNDRAKLFRSSARVYYGNRKLAEEYRSKETAQQDDRFYSFILEDLQFVEDSFLQIKEKCGTAARLVIYLLYVENQTQEDVADALGITRRQLQYSLTRWLELVFGTDDVVVQKVDSFKESCRMYVNEKRLYNKLSEEKELLDEFMREDITFTENSLSRIRQECGETASQTIYELFVEEKAQSDVASEMGISRRQLQYLLDQWIHKVFAE